MKAVFAALSLLALASCGGGAGSQDERVSACEAMVFEDTPLTHCLADPGQHTIRTALAGPGG